MSATPKLGHAPIAMRLCTKWRDIERPGDFHWSGIDGARAIILVALPDGKGGIHPAAVAVTADVKEPGRWQWNGDLVKPTLSPSLHVGGHWHGFVRAGELVEA